MLINDLMALIYELFLKIFYSKNNEIINIVDSFLFLMKVILKFFYYSLLTINLRALVCDLFSLFFFFKLCSFSYILFSYLFIYLFIIVICGKVNQNKNGHKHRVFNKYGEE